MSTRRDFLGTSVAAALTTATALAQTADNTRHAEQDHSASNPGQSNEPLRRINPSSDAPPPTDHGIPGPFWHSFDLTHRRIQGGGWTHQVTERELPLSKEIAGVNMRLTRGAFRELHWHLADEWALMLTGHARITLFPPDGTTFIDDVSAGDLWLFPAGAPHSIQGTGDDGCEFLLVFNQGSFSEESTFLLSDWLMHTPPDVLAKNFGLTPEAIAKLPKGDPLYIFPLGATCAVARRRPRRSSPQLREAHEVLHLSRRRHGRPPNPTRTASSRSSTPATSPPHPTSPPPSTPSSPAACASSTGTPTPASGSSGSRARAA